jgi:FMN-dependent NADH-azoreductase
LHLDSSAQRELSCSRQLGRELVDGWLQRDPDTVVSYRDLNSEPLSFVNDTWVAAAFGPPATDYQQSFALARSDALIRELEAADVLIIGAPMYNLGIPASLKAWIDQVARVNRTFVYGEGQNPPIGLLAGRRAIIIGTSGGDAVRYAEYGMDFRTPYLRTILGFVGITDVDFVIVCDTMSGNPDLETARAEIARLLDTHTGVSLSG